MKMNGSKIRERRHKRAFAPAIYFILELILMWLILTVWEVNFNPTDWKNLSQFIMFVFTIYALFKMIYIYNRQKNYKEI
jgi:predicted transporter